MGKQPTVLETLRERGVSRRTFLKFCAMTASSLGLGAGGAAAFAQALGAAPRPSVIWLSFQQCTGCSESLLRAYDPLAGDGSMRGVENLLLNIISLDYHESLQVAAGHQAEDARRAAMTSNYGRYILIVDGSIPTGAGEWWMAAGGHSALETVKEAAIGAELIVSIGTCAAFGGLPAASPNPSFAQGMTELKEAGHIPALTMAGTPLPLVNVSGCPPVPDVITGTIAAWLARKADPTLPPLEFDAQGRPTAFYGSTVHDNCPRLEHFNVRYAQSFDDEGARKGWCLYLLGCKGPSTYNACTTVKWNQGTSFPMKSGHGCIGCSEPGFWDKPGGLYT